jgi:hypothetical protein
VVLQLLLVIVVIFFPQSVTVFLDKEKVIDLDKVKIERPRRAATTGTRTSTSCSSSSRPSPRPAAPGSRVEPVPAPAAEGPAFTTGVKLLATALVASVAIVGWRAAPSLLAGRASMPALLFLGLVLAFVGVGYASILRSRTRITGTHIEQTWIVDKRVAIADITQVKFIYIPGLTWLVTPRLIVKARFPGSMVFHAAEPRVLTAFARLALGQPPFDAS